MWRATRSAAYRDRDTGNSELSALFAFIPRAYITSKPKRSYDSGGVKVKRLDDSAESFTKHLFYRVNMNTMPGAHTTYWQSTRNPNNLRVCHNTSEEMDAYGMDYDRITRKRYRELKLEAARHELAMQESDNDGHPFKDAGR